jgi:protein-disulfide isomerase
VTLKVPVSPNDHAQGPADAPVTLVEYGDYQCPGCGQAYPIIKAVQKRLGKNLRFVFRNMPLAQLHPYAELAAEAAESAATQGKFWEMHDALYENQSELGPQLIPRLADTLQLSRQRLELDIDSHRFLERIKADFLGGVRSGVNGTPTFFLNGRRYDDRFDEEMLVAALKRLA